MKFGDLEQLFRKVAPNVYADNSSRTRRGVQDDHLPIEVLWHIFNCLVKGCIGMAYPPRKNTFTAMGGLQPEQGEFGWPLPEALPPAGQAGRLDDIIHFDMDPSNMFIGDDDASNPHIPLVKVADFGVARSGQDTRRDAANAGPPYNVAQAMRIWTLRTLGKHDHLIPEQFTRDWDNVRAGSDPFTEGLTTVGPPPNGVAGNYSALWSNTYQIGLIMRCAMTLFGQNIPPVPGKITDPVTGAQIVSYGYELMDPAPGGPRQQYGTPLCLLVARCLCHYPSDRPTLQELDTATTAGAVVPPAGYPQAVTDWVNKYLRQPRPPQPRMDLYKRPQFDPAGNLNILVCGL